MHPLSAASRALLSDVLRRSERAGALEAFLMTRSEIAVANALVRRGLLVRGTFDGVGGGAIYYAEPKRWTATIRSFVTDQLGNGD